MLDISNALQVQHFSVLTVFELAGNPTNPLWVQPEGLVFIMSNNVIYGSLSFNIICVQTRLL